MILFDRSAHLLRRSYQYSRFSHAAGESGCASFTRCVSVQYLLNRCTFFNVSYKGNHSHSDRFAMPRDAHKRGNDIHTNGLSSEKVCVPCAVDDAGRSYAKPGKLGKVSSECIERILGEKIAPGATLCTDQERAYLLYADRNNLKLMQMDTDCRTVHKDGRIYGIQRINAYHSRLKTFIRKFHGVSTKYLGNYIVWHALLSGNHRNSIDFLQQLCGQVLFARITRYGHDIPDRPPLPVTA